MVERIKKTWLLISAFSILLTLIIINSKDTKGRVQQHNCDFPMNHQKPEEISLEEIFEYFTWSNSSSCRLAHDFGGRLWGPNQLTRVRGYDGQKSVCVQPESLAPPYNSCIVYSFGINYEWSFDEAMENYGCQVYAFDPSMDQVAEKFDHSPGIHFYKIGLSAKDETPAYGSVLHTLGRIRRMLGHEDRVIDYLKIDIERREWEVLPQLMDTGELDRIRQLGVEIHLPCCDSSAEIQKVAEILRTLERDFGMVRFNSKLNPWSLVDFALMGGKVPFCYEIAWYNSRFLQHPTL